VDERANELSGKAKPTQQSSGSPGAPGSSKTGCNRVLELEALLALENEGSVVLLPYRGAIVTPLSAGEAEEIAELRLAIIPLIAKAAYPHLSPADLALAERGVHGKSNPGTRAHWVYLYAG
jgi:hypothetical protein